MGCTNCGNGDAGGGGAAMRPARQSRGSRNRSTIAYDEFRHVGYAAETNTADAGDAGVTSGGATPRSPA